VGGDLADTDQAPNLRQNALKKTAKAQRSFYYSTILVYTFTFNGLAAFASNRAPRTPGGDIGYWGTTQAPNLRQNAPKNPANAQRSFYYSIILVYTFTFNGVAVFASNRAPRTPAKVPK
jgi:hypothetical protein